MNKICSKHLGDSLIGIIYWEKVCILLVIVTCMYHDARFRECKGRVWVSHPQFNHRSMIEIFYVIGVSGDGNINVIRILLIIYLLTLLLIYLLTYCLSYLLLTLLLVYLQGSYLLNYILSSYLITWLLTYLLMPLIIYLFTYLVLNYWLINYLVT